MNKKELKHLEMNLKDAIYNLKQAQDEYLDALAENVRVISAVHDISVLGNRKIYKWMDNGCDLKVGDIAMVTCQGRHENVLVVNTEDMPYMHAQMYKKALCKVDVGGTYGQSK